MKLHLHIHEPLHSPSTAQAGPTLLVLHGLLGSASNWGSFGRHFAGRARILVPDLRNHGASPHDGDMSYEALAADILELLDDQDLARVHLLGHSMGGKAALCLACRWPHRVASLLLADITEREFDESEHRWIFDLLQGLDPGRFRTLLEAEAALAGAVSDRGLRQFLLKTLERDPQGPGLRFRVNLPVLSREYSRIRGGARPGWPLRRARPAGARGALALCHGERPAPHAPLAAPAGTGHGGRCGALAACGPASGLPGLLCPVPRPGGAR
jgi:pimeloyl-ACP methyl ester carboxylesterase